MKTHENFWKDKKEIAKQCEDKNCRLYHDVSQDIFFVVKKFSDGSVLHTKESQVFKSENIEDIKHFITNYQN